MIAPGIGIRVSDEREGPKTAVKLEPSPTLVGKGHAELGKATDNSLGRPTTVKAAFRGPPLLLRRMRKKGRL
jgi:hypothetical protein